MKSHIKPLLGGLSAVALHAAGVASAGQLQILYRFTGQGDGANPAGALVQDGRGNLHGLANQGGAGNSPVIYEVSPADGGGWKEQVLYDFPIQSSRESPFPSLTIDHAGALFGADRLNGLLARRSEPERRVLPRPTTEAQWEAKYGPDAPTSTRGPSANASVTRVARRIFPR